MIVVTGASGNVGRPLVQALAGAGEKVTAVSRRPEPDMPEGVVHVAADLLRSASLEPALDGAEALFLLTPADLHAGGDLAGVLDVVRAAGVQRVVLLSSQGVGTGRHPSGLEDAVTGSGMRWTLLRPGGFASNDLGWWSGSVRAGRTVFTPFADVAIPVVDPADIADVAAAVLRDEGHAGRTYELTGPAPISPRQRVAALAAALGEEVRLVEQTRSDAKAQMLRFMPEPVAEATLDALGTPTPAEHRVSPDVERVAGRPPRAYAEWARRNAAAFH